jgi:hypothetical protein
MCQMLGSEDFLSALFFNVTLFSKFFWVLPFHSCCSKGWELIEFCCSDAYSQY